MKAVIQRVKRASVTIEGRETRSIGPGLCILFGVRTTDDPAECEKLAQKCASLRIFEDDEGKLNVSAEQLGLEALVVSNFTLYGDTRRGRPPSSDKAANPPLSTDCYERFVECLRATQLKAVKTGEFGAEMQLELVNDGPVTIVIETDDWK